MGGGGGLGLSSTFNKKQDLIPGLFWNSVPKVTVCTNLDSRTKLYYHNYTTLHHFLSISLDEQRIKYNESITPVM